MSFQLPTLKNDGRNHFPSMFGISEERFHELVDHVNEDLHTADKEAKLTKSKVLEVFIEKAENVEEVAFLSFMAGSFSQQLENN